MYSLCSFFPFQRKKESKVHGVKSRQSTRFVTEGDMDVNVMDKPLASAMAKAISSPQYSVAYCVGFTY